MSDDVSALACVDLGGRSAHAVAVGVHRRLVARGIVEDRLSDCVLGDAGGFRLTEVGAAMVGSGGPWSPSRTVGVEYCCERTIVAPWGEGYAGTVARWPACGHSAGVDRHPELDGLHGWLAGGAVPLVACPSCGGRAPFDALVLAPRWSLAELTVKFWNWPPLSEAFVADVVALLPPGAVVATWRI